MFYADQLAKQGALEQSFSIGRLEQLSGVSRRVIYRYVEAGVVDPPDRSSRRHVWAHNHLTQIAEARKQTKDGASLLSIAAQRTSGNAKKATRNRQGSPAREAILESSQFIQIAPGVLIHVTIKLSKARRQALLRLAEQAMNAWEPRSRRV